MKKVKLKVGEIICPRCDGEGEVRIFPKRNRDILVSSPCKVCKGNKKIDWLNRIFGVDK